MKVGIENEGRLSFFPKKLQLQNSKGFPLPFPPLPSSLSSPLSPLPSLFSPLLSSPKEPSANTAQVDEAPSAEPSSAGKGSHFSLSSDLVDHLTEAQGSLVASSHNVLAPV